MSLESGIDTDNVYVTFVKILDCKPSFNDYTTWLKPRLPQVSVHAMNVCGPSHTLRILSRSSEAHITTVSQYNPPCSDHTAVTYTGSKKIFT